MARTLAPALAAVHLGAGSGVYHRAFAETADWLLDRLGLEPTAVLRWGPVGMQQVSEARRGGLRLTGFAGNTAPDHVDHFHAMAEWLHEMPR